MTIDAPLALYEGEVLDEWVDYNGHLNVAYFVLAFDLATDKLFDFVGIGVDYIEQRGKSMFALETHVTYQRELHRGNHLRVTSRLLDFDAKRLHFFHQMYHGSEGFLVATSEWLVLHIDMAVRRSTPFPDDIATRLAAIRDAHATLPPAPEVGRVIGLKPARKAGT